MPVTKSAKKALRVATRRANENRQFKVRLKLAVKTAKTGDPKAQSLIDRAVKNRIIHRNKAARMKSRLMAPKTS